MSFDAIDFLNGLFQEESTTDRITPDTLSEKWRERWEERVHIMIHDGGVHPELAEAKALEDIIEQMNNEH